MRFEEKEEEPDEGEKEGKEEHEEQEEQEEQEKQDASKSIPKLSSADWVGRCMIKTIVRLKVSCEQAPQAPKANQTTHPRQSGIIIVIISIRKTREVYF